MLRSVPLCCLQRDLVCGGDSLEGIDKAIDFKIDGFFSCA